MLAKSPLFEVEIDNQTAIIIPQGDLNELEFERITAEGDRILKLFDEGGLTRVVVDFEHSDLIGSSGLWLLLQLWQRVERTQGRMALCNLSSHESEVLKVIQLDSRWPAFDSLAEATNAVRLSQD